MNISRNNSLTSDDTLDNSLGSKFRRLKIQENVLSASVNKCFSSNDEEINGKNNYEIELQRKKYFSKLKDKFREVKHLFEDVTLKTNDLDNLEKSDIDELKRDILELETKIRITKQFLASELQNLRYEERNALQQETSETLLHEERIVKRRETPKIKEYKEIVPSPVRVMINSPFKCIEVQRFQDFMKSSINRYGGWNEYNHNIFVQIWNKYFGDNNNMMMAVKSIEDTFSYQDFKEEVLNKIPGLSFESIDAHSKWYSEYLELKSNQQKALNKWKENKTKIKPSRKASLEIDKATLDEFKFSINTKRGKQRDKKFENELTNNNWTRTCTGVFSEKLTEYNIIRSNKNYTSNDRKSRGTPYEEDQSIDKRIDRSTFLKPTMQWLMKHESEKETYDFNKGVENIAKLRIPTWRLNLNN